MNKKILKLIHYTIVKLLGIWNTVFPKWKQKVFAELLLLAKLRAIYLIYIILKNNSMTLLFPILQSKKIMFPG